MSPKLARGRVRLALLTIALLLAGCASDELADHASDRWTFTEREGADAAETQHALGGSDGFDAERRLSARAGMAQLGGQWHGALPEGVTFTLRFNATIDAAVQFRMTTSDAAAASGRCDWGEGVGEKEVALGYARMSNTSRTCEIVFTPSVTILDDDGPTLRWEIRAEGDAAAPWSVAFSASR